MTNEVFIKSSYDPEEFEPSGESNESRDFDEEGGDDDEEEEEDDITADIDEFSEDLVIQYNYVHDMYRSSHLYYFFLKGEVDELQLLAPDIADRLVVRKRDKFSCVESEITYYKEHLLRHIEVR